MSILEHIAELRDRLLRCVLALAITTTVSFVVLYQPVLSFVTRSYCSIPAKFRVATAGSGCRLLALGPLDPLGIRIRVAVTVGLVLFMGLAFGLTFEFPLVLVSLSMVGILSSNAMLRAWRPAVAIIIAAAAVITPSQDPISLFAMAIPMWIFYFAAAGVARFVIEPARARRRAQLEQGS